MQNNSAGIKALAYLTLLIGVALAISISGVPLLFWALCLGLSLNAASAFLIANAIDIKDQVSITKSQKRKAPYCATSAVQFWGAR